jgi:hypothetical protein
LDGRRYISGPEASKDRQTLIFFEDARLVALSPEDAGAFFQLLQGIDLFVIFFWG